MKKNKLTQAISTIITGSVLSAGAISSAAADVMYNTFSTTGVPNVSTGLINPNGLNNNTDGWNYIYDGPDDVDTIPTGRESKGHLGTQVPWLGTAGGALPFGYSGSAHLNWAVSIHGNGSQEVSSANAQSTYGIAAEIDTGAGAWKDVGVPATATSAAVAPTGWKHQTEIGLIQSDTDTWVRLNLTNIGGPNDNFGVTVFTGMDGTTGDYSHHGAWNNASIPETTSNPFYGTGLGSGMTYLTHDATVDATNYLEFFAQANQVYSIALGGNGVGRWNANAAEYKLTVTSVPLPAAVWLFGGAMMGMLGLQKRRQPAA